MSEKLITEVLSGIESKDGVILLITQMINEDPNDQKLGEKIRKHFKDYFSDTE